MTTQIGKYRIVEHIGSGARSAVYKALDPVLDRPVALKVISAHAQVTDERRSRFFREARALAQLNHSNLIAIIDVGEDQGQLFIATEYLEGQPLPEVVAKRPELSLEEKLALMAQICGGLGYAHLKGFAPCDVEPSGVFVLRNGLVKIAQFGGARIASFEGLTPAGLPADRLRYMAPEQARGPGDHRSDIFSAGAICYELMACRPLLGGDDAQVILDQLEAAGAPPLFRPDPSIPDDLGAVIERAVRRNPAERFRDMAEMRGALDAMRGRLEAEASALRRRLVARAVEVRQLQSRLTEYLGSEPRDLPPVPAERTPVSALDVLWHQYEAQHARLGAQLAQAEALRPRFQHALEQLRVAQWRSAADALESIASEMPEHARAQAALARAREELIRANGTQRTAKNPRAEATQGSQLSDRPRAREISIREERTPESANDARQSRKAPGLREDADRSDTATRAGAESQGPRANTVSETAPTSARDVAKTTPSTQDPADRPAGTAAREARQEAAAKPVVRAAPVRAITRRSPASPLPGQRSAADSTVSEVASPPAGGEVAERSALPLTECARRAVDDLEPASEPADQETRPRSRTRALRMALVVLVPIALLVTAYLVSAPIVKSRRDRADLGGQQQRVAAARLQALRAEAAAFAPQDFDRARAKEQEGNALGSAGQFPAAIATLEEARERFESAARSARAAQESRAAADRARARMLEEKRRAAPEAPAFSEALTLEQEAETRYQSLGFAPAATGFEAATQLFARATAPLRNPPAPTAPAPAPDPRVEIRELLRQYARAFETKDLALLQQIRPRISPDELSRHRQVFEQMRSYRLRFTVDAIAVSGDGAEAKGQREDIVVTDSGERVQTPSEFTFRFKQTNGRWTIDAVR